MCGFFEDGWKCLDCGDLIFAGEPTPDLCACGGTNWEHHELTENEVWNKEVD